MSVEPTGPETGAAFLSGIPLVDAHHHFWQLDRFPYRWLAPDAPPARVGDKSLIRRNYLPDDYLAEMAGLPVSASVHVQANCGAADPAEETAFLQALSDRTGWPTAVIGEVDLTDPGAADLVHRHRAFPVLRGVRTPVAWDEAGRWRVAARPGVLSDAQFREGARLLADHDLCLEMVVVPQQLDEVAQFAQLHPTLRIVINHFATLEPAQPGNAAAWTSGIAKLGAAANVHVKLSGLWTVDRDWAPDILAPYVRHLLDHLGAGRVLYGSNLPVERLNCPPGRQFAHLSRLLATCPDDALRSIFSDTARRVYRLPGAPEPNDQPIPSTA